jgi:hypothetical protein
MPRGDAGAPGGMQCGRDPGREVASLAPVPSWSQAIARQYGRSRRRQRTDRAWSHVGRRGDGTVITVRMLQPDDREAFVAGFERLSPESCYARFFTAVPRLSDAMLRRLLDTDGIDHVALAAWRTVDGNVAVYEVDLGHDAAAERSLVFRVLRLVARGLQGMTGRQC